MKQFLMVASTLVLTFSYAAGQAQNKRSAKLSKAEQQIAEANRQWALAITKGDAKALEQLFADDIIVTSGSGEIRNKAGEIKDSTGNGGPPDADYSLTRPFTTEDVRIRVYKDAAVVTGRAVWGFKYKGQEVNQERRYTHLYMRQRGRWRIVAQQISTNLYKKPLSQHVSRAMVTAASINRPLTQKEHCFDDVRVATLLRPSRLN